MHPQRVALAAITVLGGLAVVGSYVWGFTSIPNASSDFWGGTPEAVIPVYVVSMLLGAVSFFFFTAFLLWLDPARTRVGERFGYSAFLWTYLAILLPSALWMPLVAQVVAAPSEPLWWAVRASLLVVGLASLALVAALLRVRPRTPRWLHRAAVAGSVWFTFHTLVLDALLWPALFR